MNYDAGADDGNAVVYVVAYGARRFHESREFLYLIFWSVCLEVQFDSDFGETVTDVGVFPHVAVGVDIPLELHMTAAARQNNAAKRILVAFFTGIPPAKRIIPISGKLRRR